MSGVDRQMRAVLQMIGDRESDTGARVTVEGAPTMLDRGLVSPSAARSLYQTGLIEPVQFGEPLRLTAAGRAARWTARDRARAAAASPPGPGELDPGRRCRCAHTARAHTPGGGRCTSRACGCLAVRT